MTVISRFQKYVATGIGVVGGAVLFYYNAYGSHEIAHVHGSWTTNYLPFVQWDNNWDKREVQSLVKPIKVFSETEQNKYNEACEKKKSEASRHIILIRHGQYNVAGKGDNERYLTELGRKQAALTGQRLAQLDLPYTVLVRSTMKRAQETAQIIEKCLKPVPVEDDSLLIEGAPVPPEPPIGHWMAEKYFFQDGPRIEAAFRKYFHRADASQEKDSYTVLICHANVIRYFVCRALQFPPEAWLRISLNHASITWLTIRANGRVSLRCLGETGHMEPKNITSS